MADIVKIAYANVFHIRNIYFDIYTHWSSIPNNYLVRGKVSVFSS